VISDDELDRELRACLAEHGPALRRFLRGSALRLPDHLADEIVNDALAVVATKWRHGQEIRDLRAYLFGVARNSAVDRLEEKFRKAEITDQETVNGNKEAIDMITEVDLAEDLYQAIRELPAQQQRVIGCRYLRDFSIAETAEILGIAPGTVGSTTSAAIRNLREIMKHEGGNRAGDI
jgi:RNA polymerase sigma-70 factor (ECF subfamily)